MRVILCDTCGVRIFGGIYGSPLAGTDFCSPKCAGTEPEGCQHEENMDGTTNSTEEGMRRLLCKACGYDRVEAVE